MTDKRLNRICTAVFIAAAMLVTFLLVAGNARDLGQREINDPEVSEWYRALMMPDNPQVSCCGEADAYWCDGLETTHDKDGAAHNFCIITDDRPDTFPHGTRPHIPVGTKVEIPDHKIKWDQGNPTGHSVVFLSLSRPLGSEAQPGNVYCFVMAGGV